MRRPTPIVDSKLNAGRPLRRTLVRRLLGLTLIVAGLAMVMSGIGSAFFH